MARKLGFRASFADQIRANKAALEYYAHMSGRETPKEQAVLHEDVKAKQQRGPRKLRAADAIPTEAETQRAIIAYLCVHPKVALVIRLNSGAVQSDKYYVEFSHIYSRGFKGETMRLPDIYALLRNGRTLWIECKREGWTVPRNQREIEQRNFLHHVIACDGIGIFATCVEDVGAVL